MSRGPRAAGHKHLNAVGSLPTAFFCVEKRMGTLYLVATPIGNLEDISARAVRVLGSVSVVACEDTRRTRPLLSHLGISVPTVSYHDHNESSRSKALLERLQGGEDVALVSDAGTPCVADPGYVLVRLCSDEGVPVVSIPGPSAAVVALSASGLPVHAWSFEGFAPRDRKTRRELLERAKNETSTMILYESPKRLLSFLKEALEVLGETRELCVARELTKLHEEYVRGSTREVYDDFSARERIRGEIVVLISGAEEVVEEALDMQRVAALIETLREAGCGDRTIRDALVAAFEVPRKEAYRLALATDDE